MMQRAHEKKREKKSKEKIEEEEEKIKCISLSLFRYMSAKYTLN